MSSFAPPAEGITLEYLARPFQATLLQPILTGGLLLASFQRPQQANSIISSVTKGYISKVAADRAVKVLFTAGILRFLNKYLTKLALNNAVSDRSWDWQKEIVLVTGGCSGIGELMVRKLSERNVKIVIYDVAEPKTALPPNTTFYKVDITNSEAVHEAAEKTRKEVGHPTVLVNNAGVGFPKPILDTPESQIRATFNVNNVAHFLLVREFLPEMIKHNHGHVVTIASMASFMVAASNVSYSCSKVAALAFHEGLSVELRTRYKAKKVRTTVVHPTWVRTPLIDDLLQTKDFINEFVLEPTTVANAVVAQIFKGEGAQLVLPGRYSWVSGLRGFPGWFQENMRNSMANIFNSMPQ